MYERCYAVGNGIFDPVNAKRSCRRREVDILRDSSLIYVRRIRHKVKNVNSFRVFEHSASFVKA